CVVRARCLPGRGDGRRAGDPVAPGGPRFSDGLRLYTTCMYASTGHSVGACGGNGLDTAWSHARQVGTGREVWCASAAAGPAGQGARARVRAEARAGADV